MSLSFLSGTESIRSGYAARTLSHRLAVNSLLTCLPELLQAHGKARGADDPDNNERRLSLNVGNCRVSCVVRPERNKLSIGVRADDARTLGCLRELAAANRMNPESLSLRPMLPGPDTEGWPRYVWFDQIVDARKPGEVFRWQLTDSRSQGNPRKVWCDLIGFWGHESGQVLSLQVETVIDSDVRHWYVVCAVSGGHSRILCRKVVWL
jgi:hypothetical protein